MRQLKVTAVDDVSAENIVLNFPSPKDGAVDKCKISAISIGYRSSNEESSIDIDVKLMAISNSIFGRIVEKQMYLYIETGWQQVSKICKHKKLWQLLRLNHNLDLNRYDHSDELMFEYDDKMCFAGILKVHPNEAGEILRLTNVKYFLLLSDREDVLSNHNISSIHSSISEISDEPHLWHSISMLLCPLGDIVIRVVPIIDWPDPWPYAHELDYFFDPRLNEKLESVIEML